VVSGDFKAIGEALLDSPIVRKIGFTGSTKIGKYLMERSAATVKRVSMELGGNAPFIIFDDADLEAAAKAVAASGLRNAGQTCVCANRILVHDSIYDSFAKVLTKHMEAIKVGDGMDEGTTMGPCINEAQVAWAQQHVDDAVANGARVLCGGSAPQGLDKGFFFSPTLLGDATPAMRVFQEETFAPVLPLFKCAP
jgi:succinate-semialdehyde dehydrogenase / glutarate-semialdehyde dehydrogenase